MTKLEQAALAAPEGYALISIDALKAWGKYDEVRNACQFPAEQALSKVTSDEHCKELGEELHKLAKQAEQEPVIRATLAPPAPPEVYQMRSKEAYEAGWWEAQRQKAVSPIAQAQQAEQEPVGYFLPPIDESDVWEEAIDQDCPTAVALYAAPVRTKDLTDDEIDLIDALNWEKDNKAWGIREFARAVIAADREKNK